MLLKANQAMKILHYKLQKERKTVARLQASGWVVCSTVAEGSEMVVRAEVGDSPWDP